MFDSSCFVDVDMSRFSTEYALMGAEGRGDDGGIGLCASYEEVDVGFRCFAGTTNEFAGMGTKLVLTIAGGLDVVGFGKPLKDERVRSLVIVALELNLIPHS
jgi:hypothetical protein